MFRGVWRGGHGEVIMIMVVSTLWVGGHGSFAGAARIGDTNRICLCLRVRMSLATATSRPRVVGYLAKDVFVQRGATGVSLQCIRRRLDNDIDEIAHPSALIRQACTIPGSFICPTDFFENPVVPATTPLHGLVCKSIIDFTDTTSQHLFDTLFQTEARLRRRSNTLRLVVQVFRRSSPGCSWISCLPKHMQDKCTVRVVQ